MTDADCGAGGPQWRYTCPNGHTGWKYHPEKGHYCCRSCRKNGDDPYFEKKIDRKTGQRVTA